MADVEDARNARGRYEQEVAKLADAAESGAVDERDREALAAFAARQAEAGGSVATAATYLNRLRVSAGRAPGRLVDFETAADVESLLDAHREAGADAANTLRNHLSALRQFFAWLETTDRGHDDYGFRTAVATPAASDDPTTESEVDPGEVLSEDELRELRSAATHPRERMLLSLLVDTGLRLGTVCKLRCRDVAVGDAGVRLVEDGDEHRSDATQLHESARPLRRWLDAHHPEAPGPPGEAPLFPVKRGYEPERRATCAVSPSAAGDAIAAVAADAGVESERVRPRTLRRTAAVRLHGRRGLDWDAIQARGGWSDEALADLQRLRAATDAHRTGEASEDDRRGAAPGATSDDDRRSVAPGTTSGASSPGESCVECGAEVPPDGQFCPQCGSDLAGDADSARRDRQASQIDRQQAQIALLTRLNRVLRGVNEVLVTAGGRNAVLDGVVGRLAESPLYDGAWSVEDSPDAGPAAADSGREGALDGPTVVDGAPSGADGPSAAEAGELPAQPDVGFGDDGAPSGADGRWATVPLVHGRTVYGTLVLFSERESAFGERELAVLGDVGRQVGHAVNAVEKELLLVSDTVTELRVGVRGGDPLAVASRAVEGPLAVDGVVPTGGEEVIVYCAVEGDVHEAVAALSHADGIARLRPIDETTIECRLGEGTLVVPLREVGAQIEELVAEGGEAEVVARVAPEADVRTVVERIQRSVPGAELRAKRRREGESADESRESPLPAALTDRLTDKQQETLEAAYEEGYFEWPRESTAEDVAERMDVTSPTVHNHLRKAENEVLGELLDTG